VGGGGGSRRGSAFTRLGILGHYYNGMLDVYSDPTQMSVFFGTHIEHLEIDTLRLLRRRVTDAEVEEKKKVIRREFLVLAECPPVEIERAARTACALDRLVEEKSLGALAYYYEGAPGSEEEDIMTSVIAEPRSLPHAMFLLRESAKSRTSWR